MSSRPPTVLDSACDYLDQREVGKDYAQQILSVARQLDLLGLAKDPDPSRLLAWLRSVSSTVTRANKRRMALTIMRHRLGSRFTHFSDGVPSVKQKTKAPIAWSKEELGRLLTACVHLPGVFGRSHCPRAVYFSAWTMLAYETGLRYGDQMDLQGSQLRGNRLFVVQNKTGQPIGKVLSNECVTLLQRLLEMSPDGTVFRWAVNERNARVWWRRIISAAKIQGTPKFLRRSGATYCEAANPGSATVFLGHKSAELAEKNYIDPTLLPHMCPRPPPISTLAEGSPLAVAAG